MFIIDITNNFINLLIRLILDICVCRETVEYSFGIIYYEKFMFAVFQIHVIFFLFCIHLLEQVQFPLKSL